MKKIIVAFCMLSVLLLACSEKRTLPTDPSDSPAVLHITPSHGAPGNPIEITGYTIKPNDTAITLMVGDWPTVFIVDDIGMKALIPLFLDSAANWPTVPAGPQDIFILRGNDTVAQAIDALSIDSLPHADGATEAICQDMQAIGRSLRTIWSSLPQIPGSDERIPGYQSALLAMLDSTMVGADSSLEAVLSGTSSWTNHEVPNMELLDALLASCGALEFFNEFAVSVQQLSGNMAKASGKGLLCRDGGPDMDLACEMQIYVLLEDYKNYVVKPTTRTYAETVGLAAGLIAISGYAVPAHAIISALLTVFDFVYGTLAPSLFPAEITAFTLSLDADTIGIEEPTSSTISISAKNHPSSIKATDILETLIETLGLAKAPPSVAQTFRETLKNTIAWALGLYRKAIISYNSSQGGSVFVDPEADLPEMTWGPITVNHSDLAELFSFAPDIISEDTALFEWVGHRRGEGRIQARGRGAGERSKVLYDNALCLFCVYSGGAFGNEVPATETKTVVVGKSTVLDILISGLISGTDGSVIVNGPNGYSSGILTKSELLRNLEAGDYHISASEIVDGTGDAYMPEPMDTTVTVMDGDSANVEIHYSAKYGNMLVVVKGLPEGTGANIDLSGKNANIHIVADTLIDSLLPGSYTIVAHNIVDTATGNTLTASPASQTIEVIGHQTAVCTVNYSGGVTMELQVGNPYLLIHPLIKTPISKNSSVHYITGTLDTLVRDLYPSDSSELNGPGPAFACVDNHLVGGIDNGSSYSTAVAYAGSEAQCSVEYTFSGGMSMSIHISAAASSDAGPLEPDGYFTAIAQGNMLAYGWAVLIIKNLSADTLTLRYNYDISGLSTGVPSQAWGSATTYFGYSHQTSCSSLGIDNNWLAVTQVFRTSAPFGQFAFRDGGDMISIPPGIHYVQLVNGVYSGATSTHTQTNTYATSAMMNGTIVLELSY